MQKSLSIPLLFALAGTIVYALIVWIGDRTVTPQSYANFAVETFNFTFILCLFWILYSYEKKPDREFGRVIRDNISTIVVSLLISLVTGAVKIWQTLWSSGTVS